MAREIAGAAAAGTNSCAEESHVTASKMDFHHPYTPYSIQVEFMSTVYRVLEEGKVGILESPTGTVSRALSLLLSRDLMDVIFLWKLSL